MAKALVLLFLLAHVMVLNCQEEHIGEDEFEQHTNDKGNPSYSFGYGVSDARTGDIKSVWEAKEGDTVKGHYSVLEPDGSMRTVEYSAGPQTGFTAKVNNDGVPLQPQLESRQNVMEEKALRDQERFYDFSEDADQEPYPTNDRKRKKHPFDSLFKDYSVKKRPKYPMDLEPSEYTHSISIKHPRDEYDPIGEAHSHMGFNTDPNCKTKHKKENHNMYTNVADFDFPKQKYPSFTSDSYRESFDKYFDPSNIDIEKLIQLYKYNEQYNRPPKDELSALPSSMKYSYPVPPDAPLESSYPENIPFRPKKKPRPHKKPEQYLSDYHDDYVPKKKYKKPPRVEPADYEQDDDEYDHPTGFDYGYDDDRYHKPPRGNEPKEVVRKVVKKRKPTINLLDIFDI